MGKKNKKKKNLLQNVNIWYDGIPRDFVLTVHKNPSCTHPQTKNYWLVSKFCGCFSLPNTSAQPHQIQRAFQAGKVQFQT